MRATFLLVIFLVVTPFTYSQTEKPVLIAGGFLTGQDFLGMDKGSQSSFAMGLVDGMLLAPLFHAPDHGDPFERIQACVKDMSGIQVAAIIEKYLKRPSRGMASPIKRRKFECADSRLPCSKLT